MAEGWLRKTLAEAAIAGHDTELALGMRDGCTCKRCRVAELERVVVEAAVKRWIVRHSLDHRHNDWENVTCQEVDVKFAAEGDAERELDTAVDALLAAQKEKGDG